jgi:hypothetical protein
LFSSCSKQKAIKYIGMAPPLTRRFSPIIRICRRMSRAVRSPLSGRRDTRGRASIRCQTTVADTLATCGASSGGAKAIGLKIDNWPEHAPNRSARRSPVNPAAPRRVAGIAKPFTNDFAEFLRRFSNDAWARQYPRALLLGPVGVAEHRCRLQEQPALANAFADMNIERMCDAHSSAIRRLLGEDLVTARSIPRVMRETETTG